MIAHAWLAFWLLATGVSAGAIAWAAIHRLTGGAWGEALAPSLRRMRTVLPLAAMIGLPLLIGAAHVVPWIHEPVAPDRRGYLDYPFFAWRTVGCFVAWGIAWWILRRAPAASLIVWLVACTVFANDWIASLAPDWRSAALGLSAALTQLALAFAVAVVLRCPSAADAKTRRDLGSLLFAICLAWTYLAGVDYLTAWTADLPYEAAWYLPRTNGAWGIVAVAAAVFHLLVPCLLLLSRGAKELAGMLRTAAASIALGQMCYVAWLVLP